MAELGDSLRPEYTATFELLRRLTGEAPASWDGLVDWTALPRSLDPLAGGGVPPGRATRKRGQLSGMIAVAAAVADHSGAKKVVEFCSGSGHVALPLAHLRPALESVTLVDLNPVAIERARERAAAAALTGVAGLQIRGSKF